ncbi:hypothetical protein BGX26_001822, partial [Mortierella sp. AD094]
MDHDREQNSLYPLHLQGTSNGNGSNHISNGHSNSSHLNTPFSYQHASQHHDLQQELVSPPHQQFQTQNHLHTPQHGANSSLRGPHGDLQKGIPHQMDIYQSQPQPQEINSLMDRHLNSPASNPQSPHQQQQQQHSQYQPQHHSQQQQQQSFHQSPPFYYQQQQQQQQQPQQTQQQTQQTQQQHKYPDQHPDLTATTISTSSSVVISATNVPTPTLTSPVSTLSYQQSESSYINNSSAFSQVHNKNASPSPAFRVPAAQLTPDSHHFDTNLPLAISSWAPDN